MLSVAATYVYLAECRVVCLLQAEKLVSWGAEGVVVGSALVRALGEAASPEEGLQAMRDLAHRIRAAIP